MPTESKTYRNAPLSFGTLDLNTAHLAMELGMVKGEAIVAHWSNMLPPHPINERPLTAIEGRALLLKMCDTLNEYHRQKP